MLQTRNIGLAGNQCDLWLRYQGMYCLSSLPLWSQTAYCAIFLLFLGGDCLFLFLQIKYKPGGERLNS